MYNYDRHTCRGRGGEGGGLISGLRCGRGGGNVYRYDTDASGSESKETDKNSMCYVTIIMCTY